MPCLAISHCSLSRKGIGYDIQSQVLQVLIKRLNSSDCMLEGKFKKLSVNIKT